jgi:hypothetical protein
MLASGVIAGALIGLLVRRTWRPLLAARIHWLPLLLGGLVVRTIASFVPPAEFALYVLALAATTIGAAANLRLTGAALIAVGGVLNLAVVLLNNGMPVDAAAPIVVAARART